MALHTHCSMSTPGEATAHGCSTCSSSSTGVDDAFSAAVKSRISGYLAAAAISAAALNTCNKYSAVTPTYCRVVYGIYTVGPLLKRTRFGAPKSHFPINI